MASNSSYLELYQLDTQRKWELLRRYYETAHKFYSCEDEAVTENEVEAAIRAFKEKPAPTIRRTIPLCNWKYKHDPDGLGLEKGYFSNKLDDTDWERVVVPHSTRYIPKDPIRYGSSDYPFRKGKENPIWYATTDNWYRSPIDIGKLEENETAYLRFESANLVTDIWINDNPVMIQHLGLFPFEIDVTEELGETYDGDVDIAVRVGNIVTNTPWLFYNGFQLSYYNPPQTTGELGEDWYDQSWTGLACTPVLEVLDRVHISWTLSIYWTKTRWQGRLDLSDQGEIKCPSCHQRLYTQLGLLRKLSVNASGTGFKCWLQGQFSPQASGR